MLFYFTFTSRTQTIKNGMCWSIEARGGFPKEYERNTENEPFLFLQFFVGVSLGIRGWVRSPEWDLSKTSWAHP